MCSNVVVLAVLLYGRRHFGSNVNTLMTNQSAMDLLASVFITIGISMGTHRMSPSYPWLGKLGNDMVCFLFRNKLFPGICINAEKFGLATKITSGFLGTTLCDGLSSS